MKADIKKIIFTFLSVIVMAAVMAFSGCSANKLPERSPESNIGGDVAGDAGEQQPGDADEPQPAIEATVFDGAPVGLCDDVVQAYLDTPFDDGLSFLNEHSYAEMPLSRDNQSVVLSWQSNLGSDSFVLRIGRKADLADATVILTEENYYKPTSLCPAITYYWNVTDEFGNATDIDSFVPFGVRLITTRTEANGKGVNNVRDLGGWETDDGKRVKYGMLYRGGMLEGAVDYFRMDEFGRNVFENELGIKTEIDLRGKDDGEQTEAALDDCLYMKIPLAAYVAIIPNGVAGMDYYYHRVRAGLREIFEALAKPETYPAYFHCLIGQDRTGTLAYLINGLLGVSYEDLTRDYELSAFSQIGNMNRKAKATFYNSDGEAVQLESAWENMHRAIMTGYETQSGKLKDAIAEYLTSFVGISTETLGAIRELLLEDI